MQPWRFIDTGPLGGRANMAVDEALLAGFDPLRSLPVLRLYEWDCPTMSVGRFQRPGEVLDLDRCAAAGIPVVRRFTGGGVLFHAAELTYSLVCAPGHVASSGISVGESFRILTGFLLAFYGSLGLQAGYACESPAGSGSLGARHAFCLAGRERYDIVVAGRKMGGNAQRRLKHAIFQHGSIPLVNRGGRGAAFLREPVTGLGEAAGSLDEYAVHRSVAELKKLLAGAFVATFPATLVPDVLTEQEQSLARVLAGSEEKGKE